MKATSAARIFSILLIVLSLASCDKNRNTFLNRNYQNMVAHFNIYFNGEQKLLDARYSLEKGHVDDYSQVLDVYPYGTEANRKALAGQMDEVIKKASRVISERPISKWVDDAYFMMGQAYFFKADYFAAIETFQFLNSQYKGSKISYEATLWIIRCYMMLGKSKDAEAIIGLLNNDKNFPVKLKPKLHEVSAYVQIKEQKYKIAAVNMEKALPLAKGAYQKARYHYILGQLYDKLGERNKARTQFRIVTKGTPPYEMAFNAKINLARNYDPKNPEEVKDAKRYLKSMLRDDKNISYFGQIYYELGVIAQKEANNSQALEYFTQSNDNNKGNLDQKAKCFLAMADIYFARPDYKNAQVYYDSAFYFIKPEFPEYEKLKAKQEVLSELIKSLILIQREDSLLKVAALPQKEIDKLVEQAIEAEQKKQEEEKRKAAEKKQAGINPNIPNTPFQQNQSSSTEFYFNDPVQVARGYSDFVSRYGRRENVDNWQFQSIAGKDVSQPENQDGDPDKQDQEGEEADSSTTPDFGNDSLGLLKQQYTKDIPFSQEAKKSALERIAQAYLNIGEIYYEQLKDLPEAEKAFSTFINRFGKDEAIPKALYYMYKINSDNNKTDQANIYKARLVTEFPDSPFAVYLTQGAQGNTNRHEGLDPEIKQQYELAYNLYKQGLYGQVVNLKNEFDKKHFGSVIQPKFDLLEALAYGRMDSVDLCIKKLRQLVANYSGTEESLQAQKIINSYERLNAQNTVKEATSVPYAFNPTGKHYFIMLVPEGKSVSINQLKARFADFNKRQLPGQSFSIDDLLVGDRQLIVVKEFENREKADSYKTLVESDPRFLKSLAVPNAEFLITDPKNLGLMIVNSDLKGFITFLSTYYSKK
ncbi:MAG: tetratricopeptide repeat protein [Bacteroidetes bacterium]|nr:tetratricopeptide repeat protein [Bacteroidota bacterium]